MTHALHRPSDDDRRLLQEVADWAHHQLSERGQRPLRSDADALPELGETGIGADAAWAVLRDVVLPTAFRADHPRYLAFVGGAPSVTSVAADMAVSAAGVYAGSSLEAGLAVAAERSALQWMARLIGLPYQAHGAFVSGGSIANLSALVAARFEKRSRTGQQASVILAGSGAHSSVASAAEIMGCTVRSAGDVQWRLDGPSLQKLINECETGDIVGVAATAGSTNSGTIDKLCELAELCAEHGLWLHVDAAYGGAALLDPDSRRRFSGIEHADSVTFDPHKWLFTPYDCAAVLYRNPEVARRAHRQIASYLDPVVADDNPADYAVHLSRRARGLSLWMSLLAHGTAPYREAVQRSLNLATHAAKQVTDSAHLELVTDVGLSVVLFRRTGWSPADYLGWSRRQFDAGTALVTPTTHDGETVLRFCFVNPLTTEQDVAETLQSLL